eukprot:1783956-Ditylum_brightwellii.AAC.1
MDNDLIQSLCSNDNYDHNDDIVDDAVIVDSANAFVGNDDEIEDDPGQVDTANNVGNDDETKDNLHQELLKECGWEIKSHHYMAPYGGE